MIPLGHFRHLHYEYLLIVSKYSFGYRNFIVCYHFSSQLLFLTGQANFYLNNFLRFAYNVSSLCPHMKMLFYFIHIHSLGHCPQNSSSFFQLVFLLLVPLLFSLSVTCARFPLFPTLPSSFVITAIYFHDLQRHINKHTHKYVYR